MQSSLGSLDGVLEEKSSQGFQEHLKAPAGVPHQFGVDSSCKNMKLKRYCIVCSVLNT